MESKKPEDKSNPEDFLDLDANLEDLHKQDENKSNENNVSHPFHKLNFI
mgnify:CR=1 FL=1